jgi:hypothetical protein
MEGGDPPEAPVVFQIGILDPNGQRIGFWLICETDKVFTQV